MRKTMLIASAMALTAAQVGVAQAAPTVQTSQAGSAVRAGTQGDNNSQFAGRSGVTVIVAVLALAAVIAGIIAATRHTNTRPTSP